MNIYKVRYRIKASGNIDSLELAAVSEIAALQTFIKNYGEIFTACSFTPIAKDVPSYDQLLNLGV